jgi:mevalonate-3-kinase
MKQSVTAVAYPTIPVVFLGGIDSNRIPLYDTMGLAVTSLDASTRTETTVKQANNSQELVTFILNGQKITGKRGSQIINSIKDFMNLTSNLEPIKISSTNYNIYSGSSDSGLAALFTALNYYYGYNLDPDELMKYATRGSESVGRSLYGGLTHTTIVNKKISVNQLASDTQLATLRLFSIPFDYKSRISADEIHAAIVKNPRFSDRISKIPYWIDKISQAIVNKDYLSLLENAEENIQNAHELLEEVDVFVRRPEIMDLCNQIIQMRNGGIPVFFLIGGGNLVTAATIEEFSNHVAMNLAKNNWSFVESKVAGAPKVI